MSEEGISWCHRCGFVLATPVLSFICANCSWVNHSEKIGKEKINPEAIKALLYDLGMRGLTDRQRKVVDTFLGAV